MSFVASHQVMVKNNGNKKQPSSNNACSKYEKIAKKLEKGFKEEEEIVIEVSAVIQFFGQGLENNIKKLEQMTNTKKSTTKKAGSNEAQLKNEIKKDALELRWLKNINDQSKLAVMELSGLLTEKRSKKSGYKVKVAKKDKKHKKKCQKGSNTKVGKKDKKHKKMVGKKNKKDNKKVGKKNKKVGKKNKKVGKKNKKVGKKNKKDNKIVGKKNKKVGKKDKKHKKMVGKKNKKVGKKDKKHKKKSQKDSNTKCAKTVQKVKNLIKKLKLLKKIIMKNEKKISELEKKAKKYVQ